MKNLVLTFELSVKKCFVNYSKDYYFDATALAKKAYKVALKKYKSGAKLNKIDVRVLEGKELTKTMLHHLHAVEIAKKQDTPKYIDNIFWKSGNMYYFDLDGVLCSAPSKDQLLYNIQGELTKKLSKRAGRFVPVTGTIFSNDNSKIGFNCLIWNLTGAYNCPSDALGFCAVSLECYAKGMEERYPNYIAANNVRGDLFIFATVKEIALLMVAYICLNSYEIEIVRINEAGDYAGQIELLKARAVASLVHELTGVKFYTYTANKLCDFTGLLSDWFQLSASNKKIKGANRWFFAVTKKRFAQLAADPAYKDKLCKCSEAGSMCPDCGKCWDPNIKGEIYVKMHGSKAK